MSLSWRSCDLPRSMHGQDDAPQYLDYKLTSRTTSMRRYLDCRILHWLDSVAPVTFSDCFHAMGEGWE